MPYIKAYFINWTLGPQKNLTPDPATFRILRIFQKNVKILQLA